jgi:hypothetical protein
LAGLPLLLSTESGKRKDKTVSDQDKVIAALLGQIKELEVQLNACRNWREFCKTSARQGDIANVILARDEMLGVLKAIRVVIKFNNASMREDLTNYLPRLDDLLGAVDAQREGA